MKKPRIKKVARGMLECGPFEASRFYLSEGDDFSGWVIRNRNDRSEVTDPIPTEKLARQIMVEMESARQARQTQTRGSR